MASAESDSGLNNTIIIIDDQPPYHEYVVILDDDSTPESSPSRSITPSTDEEGYVEPSRGGAATTSEHLDADLRSDSPSEPAQRSGDEEVQCVAVKSRRLPADAAATSKSKGQPTEPYVGLRSCPFGLSCIRAGKTVELKNGKFLRVTSIKQSANDSSDIRLRGYRFESMDGLPAYLPDHTNEVCLILTVDFDDRREILKRAADEAKLSDVRRIRHVVVTNRDYPALSFAETSGLLRKANAHEYPLVCRWKQLTFPLLPCDEVALAKIREDEVAIFSSDPSHRVPDARLWSSWREGNIVDIDDIGESQPHPSDTPSPQSSPAFVTSAPSSPGMASFALGPEGGRRTQTVRPRGYTFGDCFCGAGGMSSAAQQAGFKIVFGFDHNKAAMATYHVNFPEADNLLMGVDQFCQGIGRYTVDVLHISPPCQYFSSAHTTIGKDDDANSAAIFAVEELIKATRPRIVTLENTFGLRSRFPHYYNSVLRMFTDNGFSVRHSIFNFLDYGLAQPRKRIMVVAACPGEVLPRFPRRTHRGGGDPKGNLLPLVTINQVIGDNPGNFPDDSFRHEKYSGDVPLRSCITCNGGNSNLNYHPSGRGFTRTEFAALQGFPASFRFEDQGARRQIGNAVPPNVGKVFLSEIRKTLEHADKCHKRKGSGTCTTPEICTGELCV